MDICPASLLDSTRPIHNIRTRVHFVVDAELDESKLRSALDRLLRWHWRKLGGRLVWNKSTGHFDYHVPTVFEDDWPLFNWSSEYHDGPIPFPRADTFDPGSITFLPNAANLIRCFTPPEWRQMSRHSISEEPLIWVHICSFTNGTVVGVNTPHAVFDQMGLGIFLKTWIAVIKGEIPPELVDSQGSDEDPARDQQLLRHCNQGQLRMLGAWDRFRRTLRLLQDMVTDPVDDSCGLFIPMQLVDTLLKRFRRGDGSDEPEAMASTLTRGDVVSAILMKMSFFNCKSPTRIHFNAAINLRDRTLRLPPNKVYLHNAVTYGGVQFLADRETSIRSLALHHRSSILNGLQADTIEIGQAVLREHTRRDRFVMFCEPGERLFHVTSWADAWLDLDFGPAVKGGRDSCQRTRMTVIGQSRESGFAASVHRFDSQIMYKDSRGFWCNFGAGTKTLAKVKASIRNDSFFSSTAMGGEGRRYPLLAVVAISLLLVAVVAADLQHRNLHDLSFAAPGHRF